MGSLSEVLKQRRKELGLTLSQIADEMNVAEATVQRWESGNIKTIRHEKIAKLADLLKVSSASLMGWEENENKPTAPEDGEPEGYSDLTPEHRKFVNKMIEELLNIQNCTT